MEIAIGNTMYRLFDTESGYCIGKRTVYSKFVAKLHGLWVFNSAEERDERFWKMVVE